MPAARKPGAAGSELPIVRCATEAVKTPQARERRIASYIELLSEGRTLN